MTLGIEQNIPDYSGEALMPNGQLQTIRPADYRGMIGDVTRRLAQSCGVLLDEQGVAARATHRS